MENQTNSNLVAKVKEIQKSTYTWKRLENLWTGDPEKMLYFPSKEVNGEMWDSTFICDLEYEHEGLTEIHKIRLYGDLADSANRCLRLERRRSLIHCEGHVKQITWTDDNGEEHAGHNTIIKKERFRIVKLGLPEEAPAQIDPDANPFEVALAAEEEKQEVLAVREQAAMHNRAELKFVERPVFNGTGTDGEIEIDEAPF